MSDNHGSSKHVASLAMRYELPSEVLDELVVSEEVREALAADSGKRVELADVAWKAGFNPAVFGL